MILVMSAMRQPSFILAMRIRKLSLSMRSPDLVARAGIIREEALNAGLENNVLRGFASDVWYRYPESYPEGGMGKKDDLPPANYDFYKRDNVVCVPHTGTQTTKAREIYIRQTLNQLDDYLARF